MDKQEAILILRASLDSDTADEIIKLLNFECQDCHHTSDDCGGDYVNVWDYEGAAF